MGSTLKNLFHHCRTSRVNQLRWEVEANNWWISRILCSKGINQLQTHYLLMIHWSNLILLKTCSSSSFRLSTTQMHTHQLGDRRCWSKHHRWTMAQTGCHSWVMMLWTKANIKIRLSTPWHQRPGEAWCIGKTLSLQTKVTTRPSIRILRMNS